VRSVQKTIRIRKAVLVHEQLDYAGFNMAAA
jgi:hypothetical protein